MTVPAPLPTFGRLGHLTPEQAKSLAQAWAILLDYWYSKPDAAVDCNSFDKEIQFGDVSNGDWTFPEINELTAPPVHSTKAPKIITRAHIRQTFWLFIHQEHPSAVVLKFLRARNFDVSKAVPMLLKAFYWRTEANILHTLEKGETNMPQELLSGKVITHKFDKLGRPVLYVNVAQHIKGANTNEELVAHLKLTTETTPLMLQHPVDQGTLVFNMEGIGPKNMDLVFTKNFIQLLDNYYPESLGQGLILNAPWLFNGFWRLIRPLLNPVIQSKIQFISNSELSNFIDPSNIPVSFGGKDSDEYQYVPPSEEEKARKVDRILKKKLLVERMEEVINVEKYLKDWAMEMLSNGHDTYNQDHDQKALERLLDIYYRWNACVRAPTVYHKKGYADEKGRITWGLKSC
ncbi:CRAL-TRIO domain-containing protein [Paraphysoderma sedebokerense]|nr:CRAL-TRIO domain-containing protein [Paraphysoderma sedebokerense]